MSRYATKAELIDVIKHTIATDYNHTGLPTDLAAYNFAGILRDMEVDGDAYYGWTYAYDRIDFAEVLRDNLRPAYRGLPLAHRPHARFDVHDMDAPPPRGGDWTPVCPCGWEGEPCGDRDEAQALVDAHADRYAVEKVA